MSFDFYHDSPKSAYRDIALFKLHKMAYPYGISTVFSKPVDPSARLNIQQNDNADGRLHSIVVVDYRYSRFVLDPRTGLFDMIR